MLGARRCIGRWPDVTGTSGLTQPPNFQLKQWKIAKEKTVKTRAKNKEKRKSKRKEKPERKEIHACENVL
jgi:hypothetical protein